MKKRLSVFCCSIIFFVASAGMAFACGCGGSCLGQSAAQPGAKQCIQSQSSVGKQAINAGNTICPVMGDKIDENSKVTYEYEGKIYNFCCPMCPEIFKADPKKYSAIADKEVSGK